MRTAAAPGTLVCTYARGLACSYSAVRPFLSLSLPARRGLTCSQLTGRAIQTPSFCPRAATDTCRVARTTYAGEDGAQAAMRRRFGAQAHAPSG